jgi:S-adenosylmethionine:tRNA ribosyltransferase-isomerase
MRADELDYDLPEALIAQEPTRARDGARLLVMQRHQHALAHRQIVDLPSLLPPALFVFNDTRVIPARLTGHRPSGGKFELLLVERVAASAALDESRRPEPDGEVGSTRTGAGPARGDAAPAAREHERPSTPPRALAASEEAREERWLCMARPLKSLRTGTSLTVGSLAIEVGERVGETLLSVTLRAEGGVQRALAEVGQLPLPPYIARAPVAADRERYQTVFAREPGAVAAPTAGLHFGEHLLSALEQHGHRRAFVTLHVGPGTFAPLSVDDLREHPMHSERFTISPACAEAVREAKREGRPVVAVGTTVVRTLEACARDHGEVVPGSGVTDLLIYPPYELRVVDALLTNFHLPRSTLLALVMAFAGIEPVRAAYRAAVAERYRFFSYGDAMLIQPAACETSRS